MRTEDHIRLQHMLDAALEAQVFSAGKLRAELDSNRMLVLATVKELEIIGEAATKVSAQTQALIPELPWADITGMRHRLVHAYFDIDLDVLWQTIVQDLPPLIQSLSTALNAAQTPGEP